MEHFEINKMIELAKRINKDTATLGEFMRKAISEAPLLPADRFWELMDKLIAPLQWHTFASGCGTRTGVSEFCRACRCEEHGGDIDELFMFVQTYGGLCAKLSKAIPTDCPLNGDGFGDFVDTLPLLGRAFCANLLEGRYTEHDDVLGAIGRRCDSVDNSWDKYKTAEEFFTCGECYVQLSLHEETEKQFKHDLASREEIKPEEHQYV